MSRRDAHQLDIRLGRIEPNEDTRTACACGWVGYVDDAHKESHSSGDRLHVRRGWHWLCPEFRAIIWRFYNVVS